MRKNIIQSKTEPNKNDIWLSEEGLKKYGKNGWEPLGGGGINDSTTAGAKEVYSIKTSEFKTPEDFNNLEAATDAGKIIIIDGSIMRSVGKGSSGGKPIIMAETDLILHSYSGNKHENNIVVLTIIFESNGTYTTTYNQISLKSGYDGTKFLSDDGTYKEVGGGSEPYIWDGNNDESTIVELKQAILDNRRILYNNIECITYIMNGIIMIKGNIPLIAPFFIIDKNNNIEELKPNNLFIKSRSTLVNPGNYCYFDITQDTIIYIMSGGESETLPNTNEFNGEFTFGDTIYNVSFSAGLKWSTDSVLEYKPNHTYQFRIINNRGVMKEFANA